MPRKKRQHLVWIARRRVIDGWHYRLRWNEGGKTLSEAIDGGRLDAEAARAKKIEDLESNRPGRIPDKTIDDLSKSLPGAMLGRSPHTIKKMQTALKMLGALAGISKVQQITKPAIGVFKVKRHEKKVSAETINRDLRHIRAALTHAVDFGWLPFHPLKGWRNLFIKVESKPVRVLTTEQVQRIIKATADHILQAMIVVGYCQGIRRMDLVNLRWEAIDLERRVIEIVNRPDDNERTKNRQSRSVPMHPETIRELAALRSATPDVIRDGQRAPRYPHCFTHPEGKRLTGDYVTRAFTAAATRAGLVATFHDLRRSFCTNALNAGVDRYVVRDLGGWKDVPVMAAYTGNIAPALERGMKLLDESLPALRPTEVSEQVEGA